MWSKQENDFNHIWSYEDIDISFQDLRTPDKDYSSYHGYCEKEVITLIFHLTGELNLCIMKDGQTSEYQILPHTYGVHYNPNSQYRLEYPPNKHVQTLRILFPYQVFLNLLEESEVTAELQHLLINRNVLNRIRPITPIMHLSIKQILDPSLHGATPIFFFTAKILELINCMLNGGDKEIGSPVTPLDRDHTRKARVILESSLEDPPSLSELASQVGVSPAKLKQIFPRVYGMPPYSYLRKLRMEKALSLLNNGDMNVTETAYCVGYNSISHFARVFTSHFGMKPSELRNLSQMKAEG